MLLLVWSANVLQAQPPKDDASPFRHLKYRLVGPSAGGRVSRACGVPGDPLVYYAATASGGVWKSSDGGLVWKSIFDDQPTASIGAIAVAPSEPSVVYVGSGEANIRGNVQPGNGIYKSSDGGKTWAHVWKQRGQISHIIVHPANADVAFAAVLGNAFAPNPERGVYRTTDGGKNWKQVLTKVLEKDYAGAIDVCFDPNNPRILFAALWQARRTPWDLTSGGPGSGLYRSADGGDTWKELGPKAAPLPALEKIAKDKPVEKAPAGKDAKEPKEQPPPSMDQDVPEGSGLPPGPWGRVGVAVAPSDSQRVYALIEADKGGLYRSDDGGDSWSLVQPGKFVRQRPWYFSTVRVDPKNADIVWCPNVRLLRSTDGGKNFKSVKGPHHVDHHDLWIDPKNPRRMIDSNDGGVDITLNGGESWFWPPLPISQFYHISCDTSTPYRVMGNMQDQGTASGPSNSLSSAGIRLDDWHTVGGGETGFSVADPSDPNIVYSGEYLGILTRYDHRTRQATAIHKYPFNGSGRGAAELKYRFQWTAPVMISPHDPKTIYHAANVLFRSTDQGTTWQAISPDLTRDDKSKQQWSGGPITGDNTGAEYYCTIFAIAESPLKKGVLWAGSDDGFLHVSRDNGQTWDNVTSQAGVPQWATIACIEASRHDPARAYVVAHAYRLNDQTPYLWRTDDHGKTWRRLDAVLPREHYLHVVREDPTDPSILYVGSEIGVFMSRDAGKSWSPLKLNMPTVAVTDLVVKGNDLVVGTNGRSVYILDDITPFRLWNPADDKGKPEAKGPRLFPVHVTTRWHYHGDNYTPEDRITGDNPPRGAVLNYYLDRKPREDIVLEILDADGKLIDRLTSKKIEPDAKEDDPDAPWTIHKPTVLPKEKGINRVAWNLTHKGPTIIPAAKNDYGVPHGGPFVFPGIYTLKLTVDGVTHSEKLEVKLDPRVKTSPADLAERHKLALKIRDDITALSDMVIGLKKVRAQLQERTSLWKDIPASGALLVSANKLQAGLDALEARLHNPKAQVAYDILAMKGGARLYSQLAPLYFMAMDSDAPLSQGLREVYADQSRELDLLRADWAARLADVVRINTLARELRIDQILP